MRDRNRRLLGIGRLEWVRAFQAGKITTSPRGYLGVLVRRCHEGALDNAARTPFGTINVPIGLQLSQRNADR